MFVTEQAELECVHQRMLLETTRRSEVLNGSERFRGVLKALENKSVSDNPEYLLDTCEYNSIYGYQVNLRYCRVE